LLCSRVWKAGGPVFLQETLFNTRCINVSTGSGIVNVFSGKISTIKFTRTHQLSVNHINFSDFLCKSLKINIIMFRYYFVEPNQSDTRIRRLSSNPQLSWCTSIDSDNRWRLCLRNNQGRLIWGICSSGSTARPFLIGTRADGPPFVLVFLSLTTLRSR
jgi:hypothetical protein